MSDHRNLGMGVMIGLLSGNQESVEAFRSVLGKTIIALVLGEDEALHFTFDDGSKLKLHDDGQSCCESRYMRTDDRLEDYIGSTLLNAEVRDAPTEAGEYGDEHEVQFLVVTTSKGAFTMSSHNEHNGYYGGFLIRAALEE
jgi:hypothetical protein